MTVPRRRLFPVDVHEHRGGPLRWGGVLLYQDEGAVRVFGRASSGGGLPVPGHPQVHHLATLPGARIRPNRRWWRLVLEDGTELHVIQNPECRTCGSPLTKYRPA